MGRAVSVGELLLSKDKCVFLVELWINFILEEEGLDSVLEEVIKAKGAVVVTAAESRGGLLGEQVSVCF